MRRRDLFATAFGALVASAKTKSTQPTADQALHELMDGNHRFATNHPRHPHARIERVKSTASAQHPHAIVLGCADSRVSPEIVFDQGIGDIFSVRVAGNVANGDETASIEYAVEHLHVPLCVVLGHSGCGAVAAVLEGADLPPELQHLVAPIKDAMGKTVRDHPDLKGVALANATVRNNVIESIEEMFKRGRILREHAKSGHFKVVGAIYHLDNAHVEWLGEHPEKAKLIAG